MAELLTPGNVMFVIGLMAVIFSVYRYFRDPQVATEKKESLLAQKVEWTAEETSRRFKDMQESFQQLLLQSANHIHTVDTKVENLNTTVGAMGIEIAKLSTIIDERIPAKR